VEEQEESDESLFASEDAPDALHEPDQETPSSEDAEEADLEDSAQQAFEEGAADLQERMSKLKAKRNFEDDTQKVAIAGAVAGAITVGAVMLLLSLLDLW
jgi:hypothetical protein